MWILCERYDVLAMFYVLCFMFYVLAMKMFYDELNRLTNGLVAGSIFSSAHGWTELGCYIFNVV